MEQAAKSRAERRMYLILPLAAVAMAMPLLAAPANEIATRVQGYKALGTAYKTVSDGLRRGSPDMAAMRAAARAIRASARQQYGWYPASSAPRSGLKTAAKPQIWTNRAAFRVAQDKFAARAEAFETAVASGDLAAMRSASRVLGASCKGCHDEFRVESD